MVYLLRVGCILHDMPRLTVLLHSIERNNLIYDQWGSYFMLTAKAQSRVY